MVRWCACVSRRIGKSGMAVGGRQNRWPRVGGVGGVGVGFLFLKE